MEKEEKRTWRICTRYNGKVKVIETWNFTIACRKTRGKVKNGNEETKKITIKRKTSVMGD
jgi:hypothetical protein